MTKQIRWLKPIRMAKIFKKKQGSQNITYTGTLNDYQLKIIQSIWGKTHFSVLVQKHKGRVKRYDAQSLDDAKALAIKAAYNMLPQDLIDKEKNLHKITLRHKLLMGDYRWRG